MQSRKTSQLTVETEKTPFPFSAFGALPVLFRRGIQVMPERTRNAEQLGYLSVSNTLRPGNKQDIPREILRASLNFRETQAN